MLRTGRCSDGRESGTLGSVKRSAGSGSGWRRDLGTLLRGIGMGIVELVPGVSAGTLALILGIYARLVAALAALVEVVRALLLPPRNGGGGRWARVAAAWGAVPWRFVLVLGAGMVSAPLLFSHPVGALLDAAPGLALAFFCGVVPVAVVLPLRAVGRWRLPQAAALLLAAAAAVFLLGLPVRAAAEPALWFLGLSGAIAAAVMVLPGVSGAFVLLVLGPYPYLIDLIRDLTRGTPQLLPLIVFEVGVLLGLGTVSKLLTWLLRRARGVTMAALSGLMLGSLRRLWPFLAFPAGADAGSIPLNAVPKVPPAELGQLPAGELAAVLLAALAGAALAAVGVAFALRQARSAAAGPDAED